jgi:hypothetical protein
MVSALELDDLGRWDGDSVGEAAAETQPLQPCVPTWLLRAALSLHPLLSPSPL